MLRGEHTLRVKESSRTSKLDAFTDYVKARYEQHGLSAIRLLEEIRPLGYSGSIVTLRRFVRTLKKDTVRRERLTVRFETPPGKQAQADWAYCGRFATVEGKLIPV